MQAKRSKQLPIATHILAYLRQGKNLLAFSGGVDSSALFFVLLEHNIAFDIAIIDYGVREQSKKEVLYAKKLANKYEKSCHVLISEQIKNDFEASARKIRYSFFHKLITKYDYKNLITAHHFDDRLEWFFMQLTRGAGLNTLLGFQDVAQRIVKCKAYHLLRPFITYTKQDILQYNSENGILYFLDSSNEDISYKRNFFRKNITKPLSIFNEGLKKSFLYLEKEYKALYPDVLVCVDYNLFMFRTHECEIHTIDMLAKRLGYIMSGRQKEELRYMLLKVGECVLGGKIVVAKNRDFTFVGLHISWFLRCFIEAYNNNIIMESFITLPCDMEKFFNTIKDSLFMDGIKISKQKRDFYRIQKIPKKIRPMLYLNSLDMWQ